ncbi:hypothetical protein Rwratislav_41350 [Rhodococcus wratislaviensis IFP 2016]|nr:hypothetical protein Rwratislav_41350 [Rhodococcus wratislaviensis IFP 2016]
MDGQMTKNADRKKAARAYQAAHPGTPYRDALQAIDARKGAVHQLGPQDLPLEPRSDGAVALDDQIEAVVNLLDHPARPAPESLPGRVVDRDNQGWFSTSDTSGNWVYSPGWSSPTCDYETLQATRSPLRPVLPVTSEDEHRIAELLASSGRQAIATLAAALEVVHYRARRERGWLDRPAESADYAKATLIAGRPGSWESSLLIDVILFGNGLNLPTEGLDVEQRRAAGPNRRVSTPNRDQLAEVFQRWVSDPQRYTEVAETLASIVSDFCDSHHGADGWRAVADQWLQPTSLDRDGFTVTYRLFYSRSQFYNDPGL